MFFSNVFAYWQETFADAGDGDGGGTIWDHFNTKNSFRNSENSKVSRNNMFIYTENNTESHRNTRNINIYPKTHQKHENTCHLKKPFPNVQNPFLFSFQKA